MTGFDIKSAAVLDRGVVDYSIDPQVLEYAENDEVFIDFPNASKYYGYYKQYGQLKKAIDTLAIYVCGKGFKTDTNAKVTMEFWKGWGEDTIHHLFWNMQVTSMIQGDAFAEIIRAKDYRSSDRIVNLKPISPERMRIVLDKKGVIKRYEQIKEGKPIKKFKVEDIFHVCNDRIADEQHGTSVVEACEWVINAIEEARRDYRVLLHRNVVPVRIIEIDSDDKNKRNALMQEYKEAINKGEVLVVPKGTVDIKDSNIKVNDPLNWIQSLENYFYLAVGIPRTIASPDGVSEGASKIGYLLFEPIYTYRQTLLEGDIWAQLGIKLTFNRPPSLMDHMQHNEELGNHSQLGFQPKETSVNLERE
jgi:hypothetical protein